MKSAFFSHWKSLFVLLSMATAARFASASPSMTNADLQIVATASTNQAFVGQQMTFTLSFSNAGPNTVTNVITVSDFLPFGFGYISDNGQGLGINGTYNSGSGQWSLIPGPAGGTQSITITVQAFSPGTYTNTATINVPPGVFDPNLNNNTSSVPVTVAYLMADLQMGGSASTNHALVGQQFSFTIVLTNGGPNAVTNVVTVNDFLPGGFQYVSDNGAGLGINGTYTPGNGQWSVIPGAAGTTKSLTITVRAVSPGNYTNVATVFPPSNIMDTNFNNNTSSVPVSVTMPTADLQIGKTASVIQAMTGQQFTFTLSFTNAGPDTVTNVVTVYDSLPSGFQYMSDNGAGLGINGTYSAGLGQWTLIPGAMGATQSLTITVKAITPGNYTNVATVFPPSGVTDTNLNNNTSSVPVMVISSNVQADLQVVKTVNTNRVLIGQQVVFTLALENLGPGYVSNDIVVTDCLPPGYEYVTDSTVGGGGLTGTYSPGTCLWTLSGGLGTNFIVFLHITAQATNAGVYTNTATAAVPNGVTDSNLVNNTSSVVVTNAMPTADLQVTKVANTTNLLIGQQVIFTLSLQNLGPDYVSNDIVVTDCLPPGLTYVTDSTVGGTGLTGTYSPGTCLWTLSGGLGTNFIVFLHITAQATTNVCLTNTATLQVPMGVVDPNLNNNTASAQLCIKQVSTLSGSVRNCSSNGSPLPLVTITLAGVTNATTVTDTNGNYSFSNLLSGNYTVTPTQQGNTFTPPNAAITLSSNTNLPTFAGSTALIQGTVTYGTNGSPVPGVTIKIAGPITTNVVTGTNGLYVATNTPAGNYTVTALPTNGYVFTPTNKALVLSATNCSGLANFVSSNRTVQLVALEVTQVIQDWSNSVPLIAAKKTYVRAHMQLPTNTVPPVLVQGARLIGTGPGGPLPGSPLSAINTNGGMIRVSTTNAASLRGGWTNSLNFQLPASWTAAGPVTLQFAWSNNVTLVFNAPTPAGGTNGTAAVNFSPSTVMPLKFFAFNWTNGGTLQTMNAAAYADLPGRLVSMYPVRDATRTLAIMKPPQILSVPPTIPAPLVARGEKLADWALLLANSKLEMQRFFDRLTGVLSRGGTNYVYYGAIAGPTPGTLGWANAFLTSTNTVTNKLIYVSSGFVVANPYTTDRHTHSHEIGHTLGRPHDVLSTGRGVCGEGGPTNAIYPLFQTVAGVYTNKPAIGPMTNGVNAMIYGLDTLTLNTTNINPVVDPNVYFDVMSYCDVLPLDVWISPYTYAALRTNLTNNFNVPTPPAAGPAHKYLLVRGYVDPETDYVELMPMWTITTTNVPPTPTPGNYFVQYYDGSTNVLGQVSFTPDDFEVEEGDDGKSDEGLFLIPVPDDSDNIRQIVVWDGATMLASQTGSPNAPVVSGVGVTGTNGTFTGAGPLTVSWFASDADPGSQLMFTIQYSTDGGVTWDTLETDWTGQSYTIDSEFLAAATQGQLRIIATDGFNNSDPAYSGNFTIPHHPPKLSVNQPMGGMLFVGDQQIFLDASALDAQDGLLDGANVQWISSRDGLLGSGAALNFEADALSEGAHTITVTGMDSLGLTNSASVEIFVLRDLPPQLSLDLIGNPANQAQLSWPAARTNFVLETTTSLTPPNWTSITNAPVVNGDTQSVTVNVSGPVNFYRLRMQ